MSICLRHYEELYSKLEGLDDLGVQDSDQRNAIARRGAKEIVSPQVWATQWFSVDIRPLVTQTYVKSNPQFNIFAILDASRGMHLHPFHPPNKGLTLFCLDGCNLYPSHEQKFLEYLQSASLVTYLTPMKKFYQRSMCLHFKSNTNWLPGVYGPKQYVLSLLMGLVLYYLSPCTIFQIPIIFSSGRVLDVLQILS